MKWCFGPEAILPFIGFILSKEQFNIRNTTSFGKKTTRPTVLVLLRVYSLPSNWAVA
jgi:hypothetical protein